VIMTTAIFWDVTPYSPVEAHWSFGVTYWFHFQGPSVSQPFTSCLLLAGYLLGLFSPEDGGIIFLRNVRQLLLEYVVLHSARQFSVFSVRREAIYWY
jgi:hypothetical protein